MPLFGTTNAEKKKELIYKNCRKEEYKYSKKKNKSHDSQ